MNNLVITGTVSTTAALVSFNAAIAAGDEVWPDQTPIYVTEHSAPTFSFFEETLVISPINASQEFASEVATIFASISEGQEPLGSEFEAVWDENAKALYQP